MKFKTFSILFVLIVYNFYAVSASKDSVKIPIDKGDGSYSYLTRFKEVLEKIGILSKQVEEVKESVKKTEKILERWNATAGVADADDDRDNFWTQTDQCEGTITSKTGKIYGRRPSTVTSYRAAQICQWVLQPSHRSYVRVTLRRPERYTTTRTSIYASTTSLVRDTTSKTLSLCNATSVIFNSSNVLQGPIRLNTMRINPGLTVILSGPFVILECFVSQQLMEQLDYLEFEGYGPKALTNVHFHNEFKTLDSGDVNLKLEEHDKIKPYKVGAITLPGYFPMNTTASARNLEVKGFDDKESCKFSFLSVFTGNGGQDVFDCCKVKCSDYKFIVSENYTRVIYGMKTEEPKAHLLSPSVVWERRQFGLGSNPSPWRTCGGVSTGWASGKIMTGGQYTANSRCVWAIHPFPSSEIVLTIRSKTIEVPHDFLTAVEIDDDGSVRTTNLSTIAVSYSNYPKVTLRGRLILIVLVTDNSISHDGFTMDWQAMTPKNTSILTQDDHLHRYRYTPLYQNGFENMTWDNLTLGNYNRPGQHFFILNPNLNLPNMVNMNVSYEVTKSATFTILRSRDGIFEQALQVKETSDSVSKNLTSFDGIFIVIANIPDETANVKFSAEWGPGDSVIPNLVESCGGTIKGAQTATISYKPDSTYFVKERCTWLILSPYENVTFKMVKAKFECCSDGVTIEVVDPATAQIKSNSSVFLRAANSTTSLSGPLILVTFASFTRYTSYASPQGFVLQMEASGDSLPVDIDNDYRLIQMRGGDQTFAYSQELEEGQRSEKLTILAYNRGFGSTTSSTSTTSTNMTLNFNGQLHSELDGDYKFNIFSYTSNFSTNASAFEPTVACTFNKGKVEDECIFTNQDSDIRDTSSDNDTENAFPSENFHVTVPFNGFLAMIKPLSPRSSSLGNDNASRFSLIWEEDSNCGGRISAESGVISYKDQYLEKYDNNEHCIWEIDVTQFGKTSITFTLQSSFLEENYDRVSVIPVFQSSGTLGSATELRRVSTYISSTKTLTTPIALVTFRSDSSNVNRGFRITFTSAGSSSDSPGWETKFLRAGNMNYAVQKPKMQSFGKGQGIVLVVNPLVAVSSNTTVNLTDLNLFLDDTCSSDALRFYGWNGAFDYELTKSYRAYRDEEAAEQCLNGNENRTTAGSTTVPTTTNDYSDLELLTWGDSEEADSHSNSSISGGSSTGTCSSECYQKNVKFGFDHESQFRVRAPFIVIYSSASQAKFKGKLGFKWNSNL